MQTWSVRYAVDGGLCSRQRVDDMRNQSRRVSYNQTVADVGDEETETDRVVACLVALMERLAWISI